MRLHLLMLVAILGACNHVGGESAKTESVQDIQKMTLRQPQGDYQVLCRDGTTEFDAAEKVLRNDVCNGNGTMQEVVCISASGGFVPTSTKTGMKFGTPMTESDCNLATTAARYGAVCGYSGGYGPFRIADGVQLGQGPSISSCTDATRGARRGVICTGTGGQVFLTDITSSRTYGDRLTTSDCLDSLSSVKYETLCSMQNNQFYITNILTRQAYGEGRSKLDCFDANSNASPHSVCVGRNNQWVVARVGDGREFGDSMPLAECKQMTQGIREDALCTRHNSLYFPTSLNSGATLGNVGDSLDRCLHLIRAANFQVVCSQVSGGGYAPTRIEDGVAMGQPMPEESCTDATTAIQRAMVCTYKNGQYFPTRIEDGTALGSGTTLSNCLSAVANGAIRSN